MYLYIGKAAYEAFGDELRAMGRVVEPHPDLKNVWTVH